MAKSAKAPAMMFGHLEENELDSVRFTLPADGAFTAKTLSKPPGKKAPKIYVGCAKWGRKEWVGNLYPAKTKEAVFLDHYIQHFNSIELNATHYKIYTPEEIAVWGEKAGKTDFKFSPKVPQAISHYSDLISDKARDTNDTFLKGIGALNQHLGPTFIQLSDRFSPARRENLYTYLKSLPKGLQFFVEVRHTDWYTDAAIRNEYFQTLQQLKMGAVILDTAGRRDCVHAELTIPTAFIRFTGNNLHPTDYARMDEWVARIKDWLDRGLQEVYFYMHQADEMFTPKAAAYMAKEFNKHCGSKLTIPTGV